MVGEEERMNESIIIGLVVGGGVAVIGALIGYFLRRLEMKDQWDREQKRMEALWAEEERRRKSDRRREIYERELRIVSDSVELLVEAMTKFEHLMDIYRGQRKKDLVREVGLKLERAYLVVHSFPDEELKLRFDELWSTFVDWIVLTDLETGRVKDGKQKEFDKLGRQARSAGPELVRRIREILEEV